MKQPNRPQSSSLEGRVRSEKDTSAVSPVPADQEQQLRHHCVKECNPGRIVKHSIMVAGHSTSLSLENIFWEQLRKIARSQKIPVSTLVAQIDGAKIQTNLSSAVRVYVLQAALGSDMNALSSEA